MKKILAITLLACLLIAGAAIADTTVNTSGGTGTTRVTYTVGADASFIVTIPAGITMAPSETDATKVVGQMTVTLEANTFNLPGQGVTVALTDSANDFALMSGTGASVAYTVSREGTTLAEGDKVIEWTYAVGGARTDAATLDLSANYDENLAAGAYTDTLTFTVTTTGN